MQSLPDMIVFTVCVSASVKWDQKSAGSVGVRKVWTRWAHENVWVGH